MLSSIKETFSDFLAFLKKPVDIPDPIQTSQQKAKRLFSLLAIDIPVMAICMLAIWGVEYLGGINNDNHKVLAFLQQFPLAVIILLGVVLIPFIEEVIFRLYLTFKKNYAAGFIIFLASLGGRRNRIKARVVLKRAWINNFRGVFYFSALLFGYVHLTNFEYSTAILLLSPVFVAPQIIMGLFLGYLRIRYTMTLGYLMHAIHNAIFLIIPVLLMSGGIEKFETKTKDYFLKIEEAPLEKDNTSHVSDESVIFHGKSLKSVLSALLQKDEVLLETNNSYLAEKKINLAYKNYSKSTSDNRKIILKHLAQVYHFKVESKKMKRDIFNLHLKDPVKLSKYKSKEAEGTYKTTVSILETRVENADMNQLATILTTHLNKYTVNNTAIKGRYNLAIPRMDEAEFKKDLESKYGFSLLGTKKDIEIFHINFLY